MIRIYYVHDAPITLSTKHMIKYNIFTKYAIRHTPTHAHTRIYIHTHTQPLSFNIFLYFCIFVFFTSFSLLPLLKYPFVLYNFYMLQVEFFSPIIYHI